MPVIRVRTATPEEGIRFLHFRDEQGKERSVPLIRLYLDVLIGKDPARGSPDGRRPRPAVLDTGAPLSVFPKQRWQAFAGEIVRLPFVGEHAPTGRVGGRQFTQFLGRVWVGAADSFGRRLPAVPVLALFREDDIPAGEPIPPILLGLHAGILESRHLTRWPTAERHDPDLTTLESFGQWWHLSEP